MITPMEYNDEIYKEVTQDMVPNVIPGKYLISSYGTVIDAIRNCQVQQQMVCGYLRVSMQTIIPNVKVGVLVHRLVAMAFCEGDHSLPVDHIYGNKFDHYYKHLEFVTQRENLMRAIDLGLNNHGEDKPNATFTNEQVHHICQYLEDGKDYKEIIALMNLEDSEIMYDRLQCIKCGKSYKTISDEYNIPKHKIVNGRLLTKEQVEAICLAISNNSKVSNKELFDLASIDVSTKEKYNKMRHVIESIKAKKAYTDISLKYNI